MSDKIISNCCNAEILPISDSDGIAYCQCKKCNNPCLFYYEGDNNNGIFVTRDPSDSDIKWVQMEHPSPWISVTQDLPKTAEAVIVSTEDGEVAIGKCFYAKYAGNRYWAVIGFDDFLASEQTVTAWMPRPEVYKPEGEKK